MAPCQILPIEVWCELRNFKEFAGLLMPCILNVLNYILISAVFQAKSVPEHWECVSRGFLGTLGYRGALIILKLDTEVLAVPLG